MAIIHRAELTPTKLELLSAWLPAQEWWPGDAQPDLVSVGAYRFDDPAGEVGLETLLVRDATGPVVQVPLTYRDAPLPGAAAALLGTLQHSVLGTRWVYDAVADPTYVAVLTDVLRSGGTGAEELVEGEAGPQRRDPSARVRGSGPGPGPVPGPGPGPVPGPDGGLRVTVHRTPGRVPAEVDGLTLTGTWTGQEEPALLVTALPTVEP